MNKVKNYNVNNKNQLKVSEPVEEGEVKTVFSASTKKDKISLKDFEVVSVIGTGSFGKVYHVMKKGTSESYAMKEMNKEVVERENLTAHIFAEKSILQTINHPFIVKLHYAFQTKDRLYLVLDLLSGGELFFHLGQVGVFEEPRARFYVAQIGIALGYLHGLNIIYRDLKPENAVLDKDGFVCLTDFGLAKENVEGAGASTFCGTPEYLAPEFLMGKTYGREVDWWSLGVLMYEMLFGIPPFYDENQNAMYELILTAPLTFDDEITVSDEAKDLLTRLLDRNPTTRLQNVEDFTKHPFFKTMDFKKLYDRKIPPPFKPDADVLKNFDSQFTTQKPEMSADDANSKGFSNIVGFTFEGERPPDLGANKASSTNNPPTKSAAQQPIRSPPKHTAAKKAAAAPAPKK
ncbi:RAC serine/threonine-protein kinase [Angomonas deanei]|uniref:Protein kinase domain/Protein tyrosine kinase, putative n=1 Tax=Angomonas deanei TaxID=59799 RepID=A0A7G2CHQ5_9TRYP|nr:RAC serine/threonine-protein kinase [Angomonas deanei]CAD2218223.1 Protein kinase domain/Protein tyrosine kinase, putative [Angomonas deanei]|eukprot:EPY32909.1 RAC serine/threonine-protein kinase [Angomonas deanei]